MGKEEKSGTEQGKRLARAAIKLISEVDLVRWEKDDRLDTENPTRTDVLLGMQVVLGLHAWDKPNAGVEPVARRAHEDGVLKALGQAVAALGLALPENVAVEPDIDADGYVRWHVEDAKGRRERAFNTATEAVAWARGE